MPKFVLRILNKLSLLDKLNLKTTITLNQRQFLIPILGKLGFSNIFMGEQWMIKVFQTLMPLSNGIFVDVGVNIGQTLLKLRSVSSQIEYIGFEPNPNCIYYVNELIKENNFQNTQLIPVGISSGTYLGKLNFYSKSSIDSSASILEEFRPVSKIERKQYIPVYSIESLKPSIGFNKISIIKIDVEGAELEVLRSFEVEIINSEPIILMEILPVYKTENTKRLERQHEIQNLFKKWKYCLHRVIKKNDVLIDIRKIDEIGIHSDLNSCEYIVIPNTKLQEFGIYYSQHENSNIN